MGPQLTRVFFTFWQGQWNEVEAMGMNGQPEPVIPRKGELVQGPDDFGFFRVEDVQYSYTNGLAHPPTVYVRCVKPGALTNSELLGTV